jgi:hypothetical protein
VQPEAVDEDDEGLGAGHGVERQQRLGTGGGVSDQFALPAWQQNAGVPASVNPGNRVGRGVPDVAGAADFSGGTIDLIDIARCQLDESTARLYSVTGTSAPKVTLRQTDSIDLSQLAYYTTPGGTRMAEINTQADKTGGEVVAWVIIGGYQGFTVNPAQFSYKDGSFTDPGVVQPPNPRGHRVAPGAVYQFSIDYSTISHDPHAGKGTGGYVYAPGGRVRTEWAGR